MKALNTRMLSRISTSKLLTHNNIGNTRSFIKPAYDLAKKIMPKISATESAALNAGTVGFDGNHVDRCHMYIISGHYRFRCHIYWKN